MFETLNPLMGERAISSIRMSELALPIATEKQRLSLHTNGRSLNDIALQLRLNTILPHPDQALAALGINLQPNTSQRRKADILTTLAASDHVRAHKLSPESTTTAALLLGSEYPSQSRLDEIGARAKTLGNSLGERWDYQSLRRTAGDRIARFAEEGKIDRLVATCVGQLVVSGEVEPEIALQVAKAIVSNQPPSSAEALNALQDAGMIIEVARKLRSGLPRHGMKPADLQYSRLAELSLELVNRAKRLTGPDGLKRELLPLTEGGRTPEKIASLTEVVQIVEQNPEIRAVSFDLYDTLVQWTEDFVDRYGRYPDRAAKYFRQFGVSIPDDQLRQINQRVFDERYTKYQSQGTEIAITDTIDSLVKGVLGHSGVNLTEAQNKNLRNVLVRDWYSLELENAVAMPGAKETLQKLKDRGIKICLTSNASWSHAHINRVLNRFGLLDYFDAISLSSDIGKMKSPNSPDFYHYSWDKLGLPHSSFLHVGDSLQADVVGAKNAGSKATQYDNPLAYNRLEIDKVHSTGLKFMRDENALLYAQTVVEMQKNSLEMDSHEWIKTQAEKRGIPVEQQERVINLAQEVYRRTREIYGPIYVNMADNLLKQLDSGEADVVTGLARDGLPMVVCMKMLRSLEPDRYPNTRQEQIHYLHASRAFLNRINNPISPEDQELRRKYLAYLEQREKFSGKKVVLTDIGSSGMPTSNHVLMKKLLTESLHVSDVKGLYVDGVPSGDRTMFLQQALNTSRITLEVDPPLIQIEALYSGPKDSFTGITENATPYGSSFAPRIPGKDIPPEVLSRGLSKEGVLLLNDIATRGLLDTVRIRHRARLAGTPDPTDQKVASNLTTFIQNFPKDDLLLSMPWKDHGVWTLPQNNPLIASRL